MEQDPSAESLLSRPKPIEITQLQRLASKNVKEK